MLLALDSPRLRRSAGSTRPAPRPHSAVTADSDAMRLQHRRALRLVDDVDDRSVSAVRKPGSNRDEAIALRRKIAAQISSRAEAKTWMPMSALRARPGRESFTSSPRSVRTGSSRVACSAGINAKNAVAVHRRDDQEHGDAPVSRRHVEVDVAEVDRHRSYRPVDDRLRARPGRSRSRRRRQPARAARLSVISWRTMRRRDRPERQPDADLALTGHAAREQQVGDVGAADHQDQSERQEQRREDRERLQRVAERCRASAAARSCWRGHRQQRRGHRDSGVTIRIPRRRSARGRSPSSTPGLQTADDLHADAVFAAAMAGPELGELRERRPEVGALNSRPGTLPASRR